jgi:hypothetical protein
MIKGERKKLNFKGNCELRGKTKKEEENHRV